ncbi:lysophospholipid acyltransferase family protein [Pelagibacteraceae bacterium]|nr:lysophospholipid acyltransferase family protein [Pelagibacteraceae bacterium]
MKKIFYFFQFIFIKILFLFFKLLPLKIAKLMASIIFRIIGRLSSAHKTAIKNCKYVFPNHKDRIINSIVNKSWENIGETICELLRFQEMYDKKKIILNGLKNIEFLMKNNRQAIFISIHQSNWEVMVPMLNKINFNVGGIYRHINNPFLDNLILKIRKKTIKDGESFYTPKGQKSAKNLVQAVNNNQSIFLLIDQKDTAGEEVIFFNRKVKTQTGFLKIARKFNLPIVPIKNNRKHSGKIELTFLKPIFHNDKKIDDAVMMKKIHTIIEKWIISNPSQWFWQHKRFN